jgi:hypothetical protein
VVGSEHLFGAFRSVPVERLDQSPRSRLHDDQVACGTRPGVGVGMRHAPRAEHGRPHGRFDLLVADAEPQRSLEYVPGLVLVQVAVEGSDRLARLGTVVDPFGQDEGPASATYRSLGQEAGSTRFSPHAQAAGTKKPDSWGSYTLPEIYVE